MSYEFSKTMKVLGETIIVKAPSNISNKKYDVYSNGKKLFSFGQLPYEHYKDKIGYYKHLDHNDKKRREAYKKRHQHDKLDELSPGFMAMRYLWT